MAVDSDLPLVKHPSIVSGSSSSSASSSSSPFHGRRCLVQVATNNSSTFIKFPTNARQASPFIPVFRPRTSFSSTRLSSHTADTQSISNQSKSSAKAPTSCNTSDVHKRNHSEQRVNPILNNPLLNHRKEQPKSLPIKPSNEYSRTTRLCLSSRPLKSTQDDHRIPIIRASTAPLFAHQTDTNVNISDRLILPNNNKTSGQHQMQYADDNKYDYITRWLNEVRAATYSNETLPLKSKRTKQRIIQS
jgi:hypothetical protein